MIDWLKGRIITRAGMMSSWQTMLSLGDGQGVIMKSIRIHRGKEVKIRKFVFVVH
jgi:hypothetical protein